MKLQRVARLGAIGTVSVERPVVVHLPERPRGPRVADLTPLRVREWARLIGHERAMDVNRLVERGVIGSLPEMCTYVWLESRKYLFEFQSALMGGRVIRGGAVADMLIYDLAPGGIVVWRVQGDYWHGSRDAIARDQEQRARLMTSWHAGMPVVRVTDLWETDIYDRYPEVFRLAEVGMELRQ